MYQQIPERTLGRVRTLPAPTPGQFGPDHQVVEVITPPNGTTQIHSSC